MARGRRTPGEVQRAREIRTRKRQEAITQAVHEASTRVVGPIEGHTVPTTTSTHDEMASSPKTPCIQSWSIPSRPLTKSTTAISGTRAVSIDGTRKRVKIEDEDEDDSKPQPGPSNGASIVNGADQEQQLVPYLLNNKRLRFTEEFNESSIQRVLLFPKSLNIFKAGADVKFSISCNPSSKYEPALPLALARSVYEQHLLHNNPDHPLNSSELPPHVRVGSTSALGLPLHFHIMFVKEERTVSSANPWSPSKNPWGLEYGRHWGAKCISPALRCYAVEKYVPPRSRYWRLGTEHEVPSDVIIENIEDGDNDDSTDGMDRAVPLKGLDAFWDALISGEEAKSSYGIDDALLIAYADSSLLSAYASSSTMWSDFQRRWDQNLDDSKLWQQFTKVSLTADLCW